MKANYEVNSGCSWVVLVFFAAWITHIIVCIKTGDILLLIAGAFVFPAGIIHGIGVWFNVW